MVGPFFRIDLMRLEHINRKIIRIQEKFDTLYDIKYPLTGRYIKKLETRAERLVLKKTHLMSRLSSRFPEKISAKSEGLVKKVIYK